MDKKYLVYNCYKKYAQIENIAPMQMKLNISGFEYSMHEVDKSDTNYIDGKDYFFNISLRHLSSRLRLTIIRGWIEECLSGGG